MQEFVQAVIFHSNDRQAARPADGGAGAAVHKHDEPVDTATFLEAISVLRDIRIVADQLLTEVHVVIADHDANLSVSKVAENKARLVLFQQELVQQRLRLKVRDTIMLRCGV